MTKIDKNSLKKILIIPDSFKGSFSANEVCEIISQAITEVLPDCRITKIPFADGGEGTFAILNQYLNLELIKCQVKDPLGRDIVAKYGIDSESKTAIIEMAEASGLTLLKREEYNPLITSTYGLGQMIKNALERGCIKFILGIGGSATNDGGMGMLTALGYDFLDIKGNELKGCGKSLIEIAKIDTRNADYRLKNCVFTVACDVDNPLLGSNGATLVYGPQKGANNQILSNLEKGMKNYAEIANKYSRKDLTNKPGAGAAGGLGFGLLSFLNSELKSGFQVISEAINLEGKIVKENFDLIITGEGRMDKQTLNGKLPLQIARLGKKLKIPVIGVVGSLVKGYEEIFYEGMTHIYPLIEKPELFEKILLQKNKLLKEAVHRIFSKK